MHLCRLAIICLIATTALAACGRRGSLQLPPDAKAPEQATEQAAEQVTADGQVEEPRKPFQKKAIPERPFILDGLI